MPGSSPPSPVLALLDRYRPRSEAEAADARRLRALALSAANPWDRSLPLHLTASALIVHPPSGRVLLRWHERQQAWIQVGGHADPDEDDPLAIALREAGEETGLPDLVPWPSGGIVHLVVVPVPASASEPAHEHADVRFVLATASPGEARPENPGAPLRWLSFAAARALAAEDNVLETLLRAERLLAPPG